MTGHATTVTVTESGEGLYTQDIQASHHSLKADEPLDLGGLGQGPAPYDLLLSALGACTSMTLRMYAHRKKWDLKKVTVRLTHKKEADAENKKVDVITRDITVEGALDDAQRQRLLEIANKCPVHKTLMESPRPVVTSRIE
jgi:putative redox protein